MLIKQVHIENDQSLKDILIKDGKIVKIAAEINEADNETIDLKGKLVIPPFVDTTDPSFTALKALLEVRYEMADFIK